MNDTSNAIAFIICGFMLMMSLASFADNSRSDHSKSIQQTTKDKHSFDTKFKAAIKNCGGAQDCTKPASKNHPKRQRSEKVHQQKVFPTKIRPVTGIKKRDYQRPATNLITPVTRDIRKRHVKPAATVKRPRHRITYSNHIRRDYRYIRGPWYNTRYISPLPIRRHRIGHRLNVLPRHHVRVIVRGYPYFYNTGVFYRPYGYDFIVVGAPVGAFVRTLPVGFVAFNIDLSTYYHVNDAYYLWDENRVGYLVVEKPAGATEAMEKATSGRLVVYPNKDQSEEQQAKDRYECHRWAVTESGIDPTLEEQEFHETDRNTYRRAIAACLEGRDYTVK